MHIWTHRHTRILYIHINHDTAHTHTFLHVHGCRYAHINTKLSTQTRCGYWAHDARVAFDTASRYTFFSELWAYMNVCTHVPLGAHDTASLSLSRSPFTKETVIKLVPTLRDRATHMAHRDHTDLQAPSIWPFQLSPKAFSTPCIMACPKALMYCIIVYMCAFTIFCHSWIVHEDLAQACICMHLCTLVRHTQRDTW